MGSGSRDTFKGIQGIWDMALMLSLANTYLCEGEFLKKAGLAIDNSLKEIKKDISSLKRQFPGKFFKEVDTDRDLEGIHVIAQRMQKQDKVIRSRCSAGELGLELEGRVKALMDTVDAIRMQVEGEIEGFTKTESILRYVGWIKSMGYQVLALSRLIVIILGVIVLAVAMLFTYLFVTMESEKDLLKEVNQSRRYIQTQLEVLSGIKAEREQLSKEIEAIGKGEPGREEKVEIIGLNVEAHRLDQKANQVEAAIDMHERTLEEIEQRIEELNEKSFLQRLLRIGVS